MSETSKQFPMTVTIPTPMHTPRLRGVQAQEAARRGPHAMGPLGANIRVRMSAVDYADIVTISDGLGMAPAEYMRWCGIHVMQKLLGEERGEYEYYEEEIVTVEKVRKRRRVDK